MNKGELNKQIRELIINNPELPLKFIVPEGVNDGEYNCVVTEASSALIEEVAEWEDVLYTKDDFEEAVYNSVSLDYIGRSDELLYKAVEEVINNTKFEKIIAIWISE